MKRSSKTSGKTPTHQYFLGFEDFQYRMVFVPSLFVEIRKRLGIERIQKINELFLSKIDAQDDEYDPPEPGNSVSRNRNL